MNKNNVLSKLFHRYFIVALNGMALGLFCTLIIGLIIKQIAISLSGSLGCILNTGHGKIPAPDFNFYIQKDKYPI